MGAAVWENRCASDAVWEGRCVSVAVWEGRCVGGTVWVVRGLAAWRSRCCMVYGDRV